MRQNRAVPQHDARVENPVVDVLRKSDHHGDAIGRRTNLGQCVFDLVTQTRMQQQVFRRIAANTEFRKHDEISTQLIPRTTCVVDYFGGIAGHIANRKIQLGKCDFDRLAHA